MLNIKNLHKSKLWLIGIVLILLATCTTKSPQEKNTTSEVVEIDSATEFYQDTEDKIVFDYSNFQGIYDHESNTRGFTAILTITESGNDLSFTLSVSQGTCKGEAEGKILMISHEENYHVGFFELDQCPLQFSLMIQEDKVDVKEVNLCKLHESNCNFEGTYAKRKN